MLLKANKRILSSSYLSGKNHEIGKDSLFMFIGFLLFVFAFFVKKTILLCIA